MSLKTIFMNTENSKTSEPHTFVLNLSQRLDSRSSNKHVALQNLSIYYTWKSVRKQYKNDKLKIIAPTWYDEFELSDGSYSMSDIQDHIKYIITKPETLTTVPSIHVYITIINNRLVFEKRDGYNLELQTPETMKFIWQQKTITKKKLEKMFWSSRSSFSPM